MGSAAIEPTQSRTYAKLATLSSGWFCWLPLVDAFRAVDWQRVQCEFERSGVLACVPSTYMEIDHIYPIQLLFDEKGKAIYHKDVDDSVVTLAH